MKVFNPNYVDPVMTRAAQLVTQINAWFVANPATRSITADQIRAAFPAVANELTDGMISQIAQNAGWKIS
jgi:hypothetical protein